MTRGVSGPVRLRYRPCNTLNIAAKYSAPFPIEGPANATFAASGRSAGGCGTARAGFSTPSADSQSSERPRAAPILTTSRSIWPWLAPQAFCSGSRAAQASPTGIVSMVNIFGFRDDELSLVFVETDYSVEEVSKPESVHGYIESFERACDAALEPADTTGYLERLAKRME